MISDTIPITLAEIDVDPIEPDEDGGETGPSDEEIKRAKFVAEQAEKFKKVAEEQPECKGEYGLL